MRKKTVLFALLFLLTFGYGFSVGFFNIFPFKQALSVKHYLEYNFGQFESHPEEKSEDVEIINTSLTRLLLKKVKIPNYNGSGGGISISGDLLYIVTNKGKVQIFNISTFDKPDTQVSDVPMHFSDLIQSGHPYRNDFRIPWFRVNGVYTEIKNDSTQHLFVSHNAYEADKDCISHNISRTELTLHSNGITQNSTWDTIFTASPCIDPVPDNWKAAVPYSGHISGGKIVNYGEKRLLISIGDYNYHGIDGVDEYAMDPSNPYGKFILLNKYTGNWSVFAMGNRNPSGLYIDKEGTIWSTENGPEGGDELNIIEQGNNYGWPRESLGLWYEHKFQLPENSKRGTHDNYTKPIFSWLPSVAPSNLIKIEGPKFEHWEDDLLLGTMRDQSLHRLRLDEKNRVLYDERIHLGHRIRDIKTLPDQKIILITDDGYLMVIDDGGPIFQDMDANTIQKINTLSSFDRINTEIQNSDKDVYENSSKALYQQNCATCHNLDPSNQIGPHLHKLFSREIGGLNNFDYSQILKSDTRSWDAQLLRSFLENPNNEFSGTVMPETNLTSAEIDSIILFLKETNVSE